MRINPVWTIWTCAEYRPNCTKPNLCNRSHSRNSARRTLGLQSDVSGDLPITHRVLFSLFRVFYDLFKKHSESRPCLIVKCIITSHNHFELISSCLSLRVVWNTYLIAVCLEHLRHKELLSIHVGMVFYLFLLSYN